MLPSSPILVIESRIIIGLVNQFPSLMIDFARMRLVAGLCWWVDSAK